MLRVADPTSKLVIGAYSHKAQHTVNVKALSSSKFKSDQLEQCAIFLRLKTRDENNQMIFTNKVTLADRIVTKIESHFPSTCHECSVEYQVKHSDVQSPRLQCFLCLQPSHDCEAISQAIQSNEQSPYSLKGSIWLCSGCYDKNNPLASNNPRKRINSVSFENVTTPVHSPAASPPPTEDVIDPPAENDSDDPPNNSPSDEPEVSGAEGQLPGTCPRYTKNQCPHGMNGNKEINGQRCLYSHPKRCKQFCRLGPRKRGGCNKGENCLFLHPKLCQSSLKKSSCFNENCTLVHLKSTKRQRPTRESSPLDHRSRSRTRQPSSGYPNGESRSQSGQDRTNGQSHSRPTERRASRSRTPANYPTLPHVSAAPSNRNSSEVSFLLRMLQEMKNDFQRDLTEIRQSMSHQQARWNPPAPPHAIPLPHCPPHHPTHQDNLNVPTLPYQLNPSAPLWSQSTPQFCF